MDEELEDKMVQLCAIKRAMDNKIERFKNGDEPLTGMDIELELVCLRVIVREEMNSK